MSFKVWEQKVLDSPGAEDHVCRIEDELRALVSEPPGAGPLRGPDRTRADRRGGRPTG